MAKLKEVTKKLEKLPKITKVYLLIYGITVLTLIFVNLWILLFTQFGFISFELGRVRMLGKFIDYISESYYQELDARQTDLTKEELKNLVDKNLTSFIQEKGDNALYVLNSDSNFFNYEVLSNDSIKLCYGFLTDYNVRHKYQIIRKDGHIVNYGCCGEALDWIPSWVTITRESGTKKDSKYVDCYKIHFGKRD